MSPQSTGQSMLSIVIPTHKTEKPFHIMNTINGLDRTIGLSRYSIMMVGTLPDDTELREFVHNNVSDFIETDLMLGDAKNLGAFWSMGYYKPDYLVFMDAHMNFYDKETKDWGKVLTNYLSEHPDHIASPAISVFDNPGQRGFGVISEISDTNMEYDLKWKWWGSASVTDKPFEVPGLCGCFMAMKPETFQYSVCGYTPPLAIDDREFDIRMWMLGKTLACIPSLTVGHRFSSGYTDFTRKRSIEWGMGMLLYTYLNMDDETTNKLYEKGIHSTQSKEESYALATSPYWQGIRSMLRKKFIRTYLDYFNRFKNEKYVALGRLNNMPECF